MKIAYLAKDYPPYGQNFAAALYYPKLAAALVGLGHEVHVISQAPEPKEERTAEGIYIHWVGPAPKSGSGITRLQFDYRAWRKLRRIKAEFNIDIVEAQVFFGDACLTSLSRPVPLVAQTFAFTDMFLKSKSYSGVSEHTILKMASMLENISLAKANMIIANSPQTQRYLLAERKIKPEKVRLVTEVRIDLDKFKYTPSDVLSSYGIPADAKMIFFNGWLQARKGVHFLCEAMPQIIKQFPGAVLVLLGRDTMSAPGGGSFKKYILDHAARHAYADKLKIIDTYVSDEELVKLYSACDVFVLPSLAETFGWPTIEALACGRPVVSSRTGIITEFEGQSPLIKLTPIGSTDELAQAIVDMLSIPDAQIVELSPALRQLVENNFSFPKMVAATAAVYEETIKQWKKK